MKFNRKKIIITFWCFLLLCLMYWCSYLFQIAGKNFSITLFVYRCFGLLMLASVISLLFFLPKKILLLVSWFLIVISLIMLVVDIFCYFIFTSTLSQSMLATVIETNPAETMSFLQLYFSPTLCLILIIVLCFGLFIAKKIKTYLFFQKNKVIAVFPIYIFLSLFGCIAWGYELFLLKTTKYACEYRNHLIFITPMRDLCFFNNARKESVLQKDYVKKYRELFANQKAVLNAKNNIENIVLVLGESLTRNHMEIYGYPKTTNPLLKQYTSRQNREEKLHEGGGGRYNYF